MVEERKQKLKEKKETLSSNSKVNVVARGQNVILTIEGEKSLTKVVKDKDERLLFFNQVKGIIEKPIKKNIDSAKKLFTGNEEKAKAEKAVAKSVKKAANKGKIDSVKPATKSIKQIKGKVDEKVVQEAIQSQPEPKAYAPIRRRGE